MNVAPGWEESGPPARVWRDWVLVGGFAVAALAEGLGRADVAWRPLALVLALGLLPTLLWRRTRPLLMVVIAFGAGGVASLATTGPAPQLSTEVYLLFLPFALGRWGAGRAVAAGMTIMIGCTVLSVAVDPVRPADAGAGIAVLVAAATLGGMFRFRAAALTRGLERVRLLERERLARELHDTVAHHVSAIAIRAQAGLATAPTDPGAAEAALRLIETEARRTLAEMRAMVRALRRDAPATPAPAAQPTRVPAGQHPLLPEELAPVPGIADLSRLADSTGGSPAVEVRISGDVDEIAPAVATALYRLAQESVTNARRHARHATRIEVTLAGDGEKVRLTVRDDGEPAAGPRIPTAPGYGLRGMRERAELLGGTLEAGPGGMTTEGSRGWTVAAVLPRTLTAPRAVSRGTSA